jgi:hypothetical protein
MGPSPVSPCRMSPPKFWTVSGHHPVRALVSSLQAEPARPGGDDGRTRPVAGTYDHYALGVAIRTGVREALEESHFLMKSIRGGDIYDLDLGIEDDFPPVGRRAGEAELGSRPLGGASVTSATVRSSMSKGRSKTFNAVAKPNTCVLPIKPVPISPARSLA